MRHEIIIKDLQDIDRAAGEFLSRTEGHNILAFYAPMGAGKTTFTTAVCRRLGVREDAVSSPTFAIVNEYRTGSGEPMYHLISTALPRSPKRSTSVSTITSTADASASWNGRKTSRRSFRKRHSGSTSPSIRTSPAPFHGRTDPGRHHRLSRFRRSRKR